MPLKTVKKDTTETLTLEWVLHVKNYKLCLDRRHCVGCQLCNLACPKEAIKLEKQPKKQGEKTKKATVDIDLTKCNFCGICELLCPYGAITVSLNGEHLLSVVEKESFPQLIRDIQLNPTKYRRESTEYENACPLDLITVKVFTAEGKPVENVSFLTDKQKNTFRVEIDVDKAHCPCCRVCEFKYPEGVMRVRKFLYGKIAIDQAKCPDGCKDCLDVCPITGALYSSENGSKVHVNETFCVYCGACKVVCPVNEALQLERTGVSHTPVSSGAWNKALERIASPAVMSKELKTKSSRKTVESVEDLLKRKEN